jgi:hypothetical protein
MENSIGCKRKWNDRLARNAHVVTNKLRNLGLVGIIEAPQKAPLSRIIDLSLN